MLCHSPHSDPVMEMLLIRGNSDLPPDVSFHTEAALLAVTLCLCPLTHQSSVWLLSLEGETRHVAQPLPPSWELVCLQRTCALRPTTPAGDPPTQAPPLLAGLWWGRPSPVQCSVTVWQVLMVRFRVMPAGKAASPDPSLQRGDLGSI